MQKLSATVCTCKCMVPLHFILSTMKGILLVQYNCPQMYGVKQVMYIRICSTGGNDSIMKLHSHQQSIDQCTAAQTRVALTG